MNASASHTAQTVADHYRKRHAERGDLFGNQPFANYGYWTREGLSFEQASEAMAQLVGAAAGLAAGDRVLEVGCGYGACAVVYARSFQFDSLVGIDVTDIRIEEGRKHVARHGFGGMIDLRLGDATHMDFREKSFDKLIAVECAFHFDTRADFFKEAARVLKPGGTLVLTDLITRRGQDLAALKIGDDNAAARVQLYNPVNAYDAEVYAGHLRTAGFGAVRIESITEWSLRPFIPKLHDYAKKLPPAQRDKVAGHADRLAALIEAGEDYVLITARRA